MTLLLVSDRILAFVVAEAPEALAAALLQALPDLEGRNSDRFLAWLWNACPEVAYIEPDRLQRTLGEQRPLGEPTIKGLVRLRIGDRRGEYSVEWATFGR